MFGKRKSSQDPSTPAQPSGDASSQDTRVQRPPARPPVQAAPAAPAPEVTRRAAQPPARAPATEAPDDGEGRKLVVGTGISLSGEIKTCGKLVVEGKVKANLTDCAVLEIAKSGLFNGSAKVQDAEISGCFEGDLAVFGRLYLRSSGILEGSIKYADLEIERGGKIAGSVDLIDDPAAAAAEARAEVEAEAATPVQEAEAEEADDDEREEAPTEPAQSRLNIT